MTAWADTSPMSPDLDRAARAIDEFLAALGHTAATEPEIAGTGERVAQAFADDLLAGYGADPATILSETCATTSRTDLVVVRGIAVSVTCPHHLLPSPGTATVAYRPTAWSGSARWAAWSSASAAAWPSRRPWPSRWPTPWWNTSAPPARAAPSTSSRCA